MKAKNSISVKGHLVDHQTRCVHYHSALDIIAIKFKCCDTYYPCFICHEEGTDHQPERWSIEERQSPAVLCGACKTEITIQEYFDSDYICPSCKAAFNPRCKNHNHLYFEEF